MPKKVTKQVASKTCCSASMPFWLGLAGGAIVMIFAIVQLTNTWGMFISTNQAPIFKTIAILGILFGALMVFGTLMFKTKSKKIGAGLLLACSILAIIFGQTSIPTLFGPVLGIIAGIWVIMHH